MSKVVAHPEPFVTLRVNERVISAHCLACREPLVLREGIGTAEEQELKMRDAFDWYLLHHHATQRAG